MWSAPNIQSLKEAAAFYLDDCLAKGHSNNTIKIKKDSLKRFTQWCLTQNIVKPQEVNLEVMEGFRVYLYQYKKRNGQPLSINSQYKFLTDLKLFLRRLYRRKVITNSEFEEFELPKCKKGLPRVVLSPEEIERIFVLPTLKDGCIGIRDRAILELFYASAIRRTELTRVKLGHIDTKKHILQVVEGKGLKDRWLPLLESTCHWVDVYLTEARPKLVSIESEDALFLTSKGKPINPDQVGQMVGKYVRRAGIDKPGACHLFRHAVATAMLDAGADIRSVQELLGHKDISTTQIYTHVAIKKLERVYNNTHPGCTN